MERKMKHNLKYFRKVFPKLSEEMENRRHALKIDAVCSDLEEAERKTLSKEPTAVDYIRLCENDEEAIEIIDFLHKQGKIKREYAKKLRKQLANKGLRSFGSKRGLGRLE